MSTSVEQLRAFLAMADQARAEYVQGQTVGVRVVDIDLSTISTSQAYPLNIRGYGLLMPAFNQPAGASVNIAVDGVVLPFQPGARCMSPFQRIEVFNTVNGPNVGTARFFVITRPDVWLDFGAMGEGNLQATQYMAAYNSAVNIPSLVTDGVSLANGRGARAAVFAPSGQTITAATGVWWLYSDVSGLWAESSVQVDLSRPTARRGSAVPDEFVTVGRGRAFLEVRSGTHSGGSGAFTVDLYAN